MTEKYEQVHLDASIQHALSTLRIPKVFGLQNRRDFQNDTYLDGMMHIANEDFYAIALKKINLHGQEIYLYPHINFQARITMGCNSKCGFCVEQYGNAKTKELPNTEYAQRVEESLLLLKEQDVVPSVTITGGEPCMNAQRLESVLNVLHKTGITKYNVNTNGTFLVRNPEYVELFKGTLPYLNISMHHWDSQKSAEIMGPKGFIALDELGTVVQKLGGSTYGNSPRIRMQCVLLDGYVDSIDTMQQYIKHMKSVGIDNIAFRGLSELSCGNYGGLRILKIEKIVDQIAARAKEGKSDSWEFICQNIADWYCYEDWKYQDDTDKGTWTDVHINFSNLSNLRQYELQERRRGKKYAREFVLFEDGVFSSGWNKDLGILR